MTTYGTIKHEIDSQYHLSALNFCSTLLLFELTDPVVYVVYLFSPKKRRIFTFIYLKVIDFWSALDKTYGTDRTDRCFLDSTFLHFLVALKFGYSDTIFFPFYIVPQSQRPLK